MNVTSKTAPGSLRARITGGGEVLLILALAAAVYQPWAAPGLPILDFSEFLPRLAAHTSFWRQFSGVAGYLASQGRFSPVQYVYLTILWRMFGVSAAGWHWAYFAVNAAVIVLARDLLLRLGMRRVVAFITIAVWIMMKPFADGWLRPTGETLGLLFVFAAASAALGFRGSIQWKRRATIVSLSLLAAIFCKEMLAALIPAVWLLTRLENRDGALRWAPWAGRDSMLLGVLIATIVVAVVPIAFVAMHAHAGSYASRYGSIHITAAPTLERLETVAFPGSERLSALTRVLGDPAWRLLLALPNLVWLALLIDGLTTRFALRQKWLLLAGTFWMLSGVLVYAPWPGRAAFYMIPFGFGMVIIASVALTGLLERGTLVGRSALALSFALLAVTAMEARNHVWEHDLRVRLDAGIIRSLRRSTTIHTVTAAVPEPGAPGGWGWARRLTEFGHTVYGLPEMGARDVSCGEARRILANEPGNAIVSALEGCGRLGSGVEVTASVPLRQWPRLLTEQRNNHVALIATGAAGK